MKKIFQFIFHTYEVKFKSNGRYCQLLWPSQNIWTLSKIKWKLWISFTVWLQCVLFDFLGHWQYSPDVRSNGESDFAHWTDDRTGLWHPCQEQRTLHHITSGFDVFQARFSDIYLGLTLVDLNFFIAGSFKIWFSDIYLSLILVDLDRIVSTPARTLFISGLKSRVLKLPFFT